MFCFGFVSKTMCAQSSVVSNAFPSRAYRKYDLFRATEKNSLARNNHHIINIYVLCLQNLTTCIPFTPDYEHAVNLFFNINYTFCIQRAYINIFFPYFAFGKVINFTALLAPRTGFFFFFANNVTRVKLLEDVLDVLLCVYTEDGNDIKIRDLYSHHAVDSRMKIMSITSCNL